MATPQEHFALMLQYTKFDEMFIDAVKANNKAEAEDIKLQMDKIREKLAAFGEVALPPQDEQPS